MLLKITNDQLIDGEIPDGLLRRKIGGSLQNRIKNFLRKRVTSLNFRGCSSLTSLPENLPAGIKELYLFNCNSLTSLPENLPAGIKELDLSKCSLLTSLPAKLPAGIKKLHLHGCSSLTALPALPAGIKELDLHGCSSLTSLPALPAGITELYLSGCSSLTSLPENMPAGITELYLSGCSSLTSLPENLPAGITKLDLRGCTNLQPTPELLRQLNAIEINHHDVEIFRPQHWRAVGMVAQNNDGNTSSGPTQEQAIKLDELKNRLEEIVKDMSPKPATFQDIFHKFTTQNIHYDRDVNEVIKTADLVVFLLEEDSSHAKWVNKMAEHYTQGCVNQPVQCFIEIAGFAGVCQKESTRDKMEASKQILARMAIIGFIATLNPEECPERGVEVEFANALMRGVNKKLLEDGVIKESWPGVPNKIAYERAVEAKARLVVDRTYEYVKKEVLDLTHKEIAERLLGFLKGGAEGMDPPYRHIALAWMDTMITGNKTLSTQNELIDAKYKQEKAQLMEKIGEEENPDEQEKLVAQYNSIESRKETDKVEMIKKAVSRRVLPEISAASSPDNSNTVRGGRRLPDPSISIRGVTAAAANVNLLILEREEGLLQIRLENHRQ